MTDGGSCEEPKASVDGSSATASGAWSVVSGSGAYDKAKGNGTFRLAAGIAPGADNAWNVALLGELRALAPDLDFAVIRAYWGQLGLDYALRIVSVVVKATNNGAGSTFGAHITGASSQTPGVTFVGKAPLRLGDLAPGESTTAVLRFKLGLTGPCKVVILNCPFSLGVTAEAPDAFDLPTDHAATLSTKAPDLPPPASK